MTTNAWEEHASPASIVRRAEKRGNAERAGRYRPHVHHKVRYSSRHDSDACLDCDVWLEPMCNCKPDDDCPFPKPRPAKPSEVGS